MVVETKTRPLAILAIYTVMLCLAHARVLHAWWEVSRGHASASHVVLIPLISAWLLYQDRHAVSRARRADWPLGLPVLVAGSTISALGLWADNYSLELHLAALILLWMGGFIALYGRQAARTVRFPLAFLAFMVPIPAPLLAGFTELLKVGSTEATAVLFTLIGTPHHREGFVFSLPEFAIEVADACSGIRSSIALILTMLLAGHVWLRSGWKKAVLVAAVLPVTIFKNAVRIVTLTWLAMHVNPGFLTGRLHHDGGVVFFLISLALLAPLLAVLRRSEALGAGAQRQPATT